ncbi:MAG TPA: hypothetical protein VHT74_31845 [Acetobacteraceae bacterium]|jgi:flagellar export protein FliJ|nr:hypothetical protein [Acetobacteraceae bacterium]
MTQDPLESLLRLRRLAADEARRYLANCLRNEDAAAHAIAEIDAAIERETDVATNLATSDTEVEAFAAWLRCIRPRQYAAHVAEDRAETETAHARGVLAAARAAVQAAEEMLAEHQAARHVAEDHRAQLEIDEVAQRSGRSG